MFFPTWLWWREGVMQHCGFERPSQQPLSHQPLTSLVCNWCTGGQVYVFHLNFPGVNVNLPCSSTPQWSVSICRVSAVCLLIRFNPIASFHCFSTITLVLFSHREALQDWLLVTGITFLSSHSATWGYLKKSAICSLVLPSPQNPTMLAPSAQTSGLQQGGQGWRSASNLLTFSFLLKI